MASDSRGFFDRFMAALNAHDLDAAVSMIHPDFMGDSPQTGERSHGPDGFAAQLRNYPGVDESPITLDDAQMYGDDDRYAMTPGFTVVPLAAPNEFTVVFRSRYPDGSWWRVVIFVVLRDNLLYRMETFFAPELPRPLAESIATYPHG